METFETTAPILKYSPAFPQRQDCPLHNTSADRAGDNGIFEENLDSREGIYARFGDTDGL